MPTDVTTTEKQIFYPLISCIMPTAGRPQYVAQSVRYFLEQDYPCKELIVVYNKPSDLPPIQFPAGVKLAQIPARIIGAKRNEACRHAAGSIIAHWDDDDLYNRQRLSLQAAPILAGKAHISGLRNFVFYDVSSGKGYIPTPFLFAQAFRATVACGTVMYDRAVWQHAANYPNWRTGEDYGFLSKAIKQGAVIEPIDAYDQYVYIRHGGNTWKFEKDNFRRYAGWQPSPLPHWAINPATYHRNLRPTHAH